MSTNPIKAKVGGGKEPSPKDPQACCDWANARLHPSAAEEELHWVVTGDPKSPIALVPAPRFAPLRVAYSE